MATRWTRRRTCGHAARRASPPEEKAGAHERASEARRLERATREACCARLRQEWRGINAYFLGQRLRPPSIELRDLASRWGHWCPETRTIALATRLVVGYHWAEVQETLKHEIAHQVVHELFGLPDAPAHGEAFRRACLLLGIEPSASGPGGTPLSRPAEGESPHDARLRKVRRLLALGESPNAHEAEAALAKANELLLKYNLDLQATAARPDYVVRMVGGRFNRRPRHVRILAGLLAQHFFVETIWVETYDVLRQEGGRELEILGTRTNVDLADYAFAQILKNAEDLWERHARETGTPCRERRQYLAGVVSGYGAHLERERASLAKCRALVWRGDPRLDAFFRKRYPRVSTERVRGAVTDAYFAGHEDGQALRLRRGVQGESRDRGRRLGYAGHP